MLENGAILILLGAGFGFVSGVLVTWLQVRQHPGSWRLMQRQPVAKIPGWQSSLAVLVLGIVLLVLGAAQDRNAIMLAIGAALLAFGAIRYLFRYYRPAI